MCQKKPYGRASHCGYIYGSFQSYRKRWLRAFYGCAQLRGISFLSVYLGIHKNSRSALFMVSGALLLHKDEPLRVILKKRILRFAVVLSAGSALIYLYKYSKGYISGISPADFAKRLYTGNITVPYWYLYSYLAYLLMLPFLRKLAKAMSNRDFILLFSLYFLVQSLQILQFLIWRDGTSYSQYFNLFFRQKNIVFPLLGYYIEHRLPERVFRKKYFLILAAAGMAAICICVRSHITDVYS